MKYLLTPSTHAQVVLGFILTVLLCLVTVLVYMTGGVHQAYPHIMYIPVVIAGIVFGIHGGIITGLIGGFLLGPFMPINVELGLMQEPINWAVRLIFFVLIGSITGLLVEKLKNYFYGKIDALSHLPCSTIPLLNNLYESFNKKDVSQKAQTAFLYINILNYAKVSDYLDETECNHILDKVCERLKDVLPDSATVYAKDPQSLIVSLEDKSTLEDILEQVETRLLHPITINDMPIHIETAIGASPFNTSLSHSIKQAIKASRYAEQHFFPSAIYDSINETHNDNIAYLGSVLEGLNDNDFYLVYQPQYNAETGKITSLEVLLRWQHKTHGNISPNAFIPVIEDTSLINPLTNWVIEEAMKTIKILRKNGFDIPVAINISTKNLFHKNFFELLKSQLEKYDISPSSIELEITESALMHNLEITEKVLKDCRAYGISISLDDFGTGYSSLVYLKKFDVQKIKIDRAFINELTNDDYSKTIIKTAVDLTKAFNITIVAEGVETEAQYDILRHIGCNHIQGYLFSKPLSLSNVLLLLKEN